jgi:hypothetical protein
MTQLFPQSGRIQENNFPSGGCGIELENGLGRRIQDFRLAKATLEYASLVSAERNGLVILPSKNSRQAYSIELSVLRTANLDALDCSCES